MPTENNVAAQAGDEPMRDAFEEHIRSRNPKEFFVARWPNGSYKSQGTDAMWAGWQAAMASQVSPRATADVERLSAALSKVMSWIDNWSPEFTSDPEWSADRDEARAAIATTKPGA